MKKLSRSLAARSVFFMLAVAMAYCLIFTTTGCKQDQVTPIVNATTLSKTLKMSGVTDVKGQFTVQDGILHFENSNALFDLLEQLRQYDISERRNFGENIGFKSMLSSFCDVLVKSATIEDKDAYFDLLKQNSDVITYKEDGTFDFKIATPLLASVTDRNGILYVGKSVYQFTDYGEVIIFDGDINRLSSVTKNTFSDKNVKVFVTKNDIVSRTPCGIVRNVIVEINDRRGFLDAARQSVYTWKSNDSNGIPIYDVHNSSYTLGTPWKWVWSFGWKWKHYSTSNTLSMSQTLQSYNGLCQYGDSYSYSNNWDAIDYMGNSCTLTDITEPNLSQNYSYYTSMNPTQYVMNNTSVVCTIICN